MKPAARPPRPSHSPDPLRTPPDAAPAPALHRSAAVAQMLRMPVATLRVWERRYALTATARSPGGQRQYTAADLRRLALLKQLTDLGHAIGSLAPLDFAQLQDVAATHATHTTPAGPGTRAAMPASRAWRLVVVGPDLGARLRRPALLRPLGRPVELLGPFDDVAQAAAALAARPDDAPVDAWLLHQPQLHAGWLADFEAAAGGQIAVRAPVAVLYGFAADAVCEALAARGVTLLREPQPDVALAQWLRLWAGPASASAGRACDVPRVDALADRRAERVPPRRWSDTALADFAARSSTVACECPRHVAELLVQLARFEAYSAQCEQRHPADADLHAALVGVAAEARARFEGALAAVALREGLVLPA